MPEGLDTRTLGTPADGQDRLREEEAQDRVREEDHPGVRHSSRENSHRYVSAPVVRRRQRNEPYGSVDRRMQERRRDRRRDEHDRRRGRELNPGSSWQCPSCSQARQLAEELLAVLKHSEDRGTIPPESITPGHISRGRIPPPNDLESDNDSFQGDIEMLQKHETDCYDSQGSSDESFKKRGNPREEEHEEKQHRLQTNRLGPNASHSRPEKPAGKSATAGKSFPRNSYSDTTRLNSECTEAIRNGSAANRLDPSLDPSVALPSSPIPSGPVPGELGPSGSGLWEFSPSPDSPLVFTSPWCPDTPGTITYLRPPSSSEREPVDPPTVEPPALSPEEPTPTLEGSLVDRAAVEANAVWSPVFESQESPSPASSNSKADELSKARKAPSPRRGTPAPGHRSKAVNVRLGRGRGKELMTTGGTRVGGTRMGGTRMGGTRMEGTRMGDTITQNLAYAGVRNEARNEHPQDEEARDEGAGGEVSGAVQVGQDQVGQGQVGQDYVIDGYVIPALDAVRERLLLCLSHNVGTGRRNPRVTCPITGVDLVVSARKSLRVRRWRPWCEHCLITHPPQTFSSTKDTAMELMVLILHSCQLPTKFDPRFFSDLFN